MKNWKKRTLAAVLTLLMVMQCAPLSALAEPMENSAAVAQLPAEEETALETAEETAAPEENADTAETEEATTLEESEEALAETEVPAAEEEAKEEPTVQEALGSEEVMAEETVQIELQDGTALIPAGATNEQVKEILYEALVVNKNDVDASPIEWEYECEGKSQTGLRKNTAFGSIYGFTSNSGITTYTYPALAANADGDYRIRITGTTAAVTLHKVAKLSASVTVNDNVSIAIPHGEDGSVQYDELRQRIFEAVVESTTPELTASDVTLQYYATAKTGAVGDAGKAWVSLEGDKVGILTYPAISAGSQQIKIIWNGNEDYSGFKKEVTVTLTERAESKIVLNDVKTLNTRGMLVEDVLKALLNEDETNVTLTAANATVEYKKLTRWITLDSLADGTYTLRVAFNGDANYLPATSNEVEVKFVSKGNADLELNEEPYSVNVPYTEDAQVDITALKTAIFKAVVKNIKPELTADDITLQYYATAETGSVGNVGKAWVSLEGGKVNGLTYPAISAGKHKIEISWNGNEDFYSFKQEFEITLNEREQAPYTLKEPTGTVTLVVDDELNIDYEAVRKAVFDAVIEQSDVLTAENVTVEYYYEGVTTIDSKWLPLEGQEIAFGKGYPPVSAGEKKVRISWPGSKEYAPTTVETAVKFEDRPIVAFNLKDGPYEVGMAFSDEKNYDYDVTAERIFAAVVDSTTNPSDLTAADVKVEYNVDKTGITSSYKALSETDAASLIKFGTGSWKIRISWAGSKEYKGNSVVVDVVMTDDRLASSIALKESVSFTYNMDVNVMKQAILDSAIDWDNSDLPSKDTLSIDDFDIQYKANLLDIDTGVTLPSIPGVSDNSALTQWVPIEGKVYELAGKVLGQYPQMGAGAQQIRVSYVGNTEYRPSDAAEMAVTVNKASVSVKVKTLSLYVDEALPADFVTTSPADKFDIYTISAGVTSNVTTAIYLNMPERYQSQTFLKVLDPIAQKLYGKTFTQMMNDGITLGELRQLLSTQDLLDLLEKLNIDTGTFGQILTAINKLPSVTDSIRVSFGYPSRAGMYLVTAVTDNKNYNTGVGTGILVCKMRLSGSKLTWNETISGGKLTAAEAAEFDFGATLSYNGDVTVSQSGVHYLYSGFTSKWKIYSSTTTPPTEPGRYVVTVCIIGGNHFALPLTRSFQITK